MMSRNPAEIAHRALVAVRGSAPDHNPVWVRQYRHFRNFVPHSAELFIRDDAGLSTSVLFLGERSRAMHQVVRQYADIFNQPYSHQIARNQRALLNTLARRIVLDAVLVFHAGDLRGNLRDEYQTRYARWQGTAAPDYRALYLERLAIIAATPTDYQHCKLSDCDRDPVLDQRLDYLGTTLIDLEDATL